MTRTTVTDLGQKSGGVVGTPSGEPSGNRRIDTVVLMIPGDDLKSDDP